MLCFGCCSGDDVTCVCVLFTSGVSPDVVKWWFLTCFCIGNALLLNVECGVVVYLCCHFSNPSFLIGFCESSETTDYISLKQLAHFLHEKILADFYDNHTEINRMFRRINLGAVTQESQPC